MKYVDEFRNASHARALAERITHVASKLARPVRFMEVCGGHTMAIHRFGIPSLLPSNVELLSGPGCPVCVTPTTYIDKAIQLCRAGAIVCTFGDLLRVPGSNGSLEDAMTQGADVRVVYSPRDAVAMARQSSERQVVFLAVGFETTVPATAATVIEAKTGKVSNFRILCGHKTMPPALRALAAAPTVNIDGLILPGHVSTIIGSDIYRFLPDEFGLACSVTGFEPCDILQSILGLLWQVTGNQPHVENEYGRAVRPEGNTKALELSRQVFEPVGAQWRGLGMIEDSGLDLRKEWSAFRIEPPDPATPSADSAGCRCSDVLRGIVRPPQCPLFGRRCTPDSPVGPCMVSSEGACGAFYKYGPSPGKTPPNLKG
jgi:hydrogenase expression/formation protein HypD